MIFPIVASMLELPINRGLRALGLPIKEKPQRENHHHPFRVRRPAREFLLREKESHSRRGERQPSAERGANLARIKTARARAQNGAQVSSRYDFSASVFPLISFSSFLPPSRPPLSLSLSPRYIPLPPPLRRGICSSSRALSRVFHEFLRPR